MTSDDPVIAELARFNPVPSTPPPDPSDRAEMERMLRQVLDSPTAAGPHGRARRRSVLVPAMSLVVVLAVLAVFLRIGGHHGGAASGGQSTLVLQAEPTARDPAVTPAAMSVEARIVRDRLRSVVNGGRVVRSGGTELVVSLPAMTAARRERTLALISQPAQLGFYDWEANVLTPNGRTVASQLAAHNSAALEISEGQSAAPGTAGAGGLSLYRAVKLAARQPPAPPSSHLSRLGSVGYVFGAPGSAACAAAARATHARPAGQHCLLSGPEISGNATAPAVKRSLPPGARLLIVRQGTVVLQAAAVDSSHPLSLGDPSARFFVLHDDVALSGTDIVKPHAGTDVGGSPDVQFGLTAAGRRAFQRATAQIARRGQDDSTAGQSLDQHFAVAVDGRLLTLPQIDFRQYPDGVIGGGGADITGGFTKASARDLAIELRYGALPLTLRVR
jgi:preprotein translocase subunit SecD